MGHRDFHPLPVDDCFGCKVASIGYDGGHVQRRTVVPNEDNGRPAGFHVEHRNGRQDAVVRPESVHVQVIRKEAE